MKYDSAKPKSTRPSRSGPTPQHGYDDERHEQQRQARLGHDQAPAPRVEEHDLPQLNAKFGELYDRLHRGSLIDLQAAREMLSIDIPGWRDDSNDTSPTLATRPPGSATRA